MWDFLKEYEKKYEGKNILIVTHEYPSWMLMASGEAWSEKRAIAEKEKRGREFIGFAEIRPLNCQSGSAERHRRSRSPSSVSSMRSHGHVKNAEVPMRRVPEVADVWYDSGAMPFAQMHFPFEPESRNPNAAFSQGISVPGGLYRRRHGPDCVDGSIPCSPSRPRLAIRRRIIT